ncbi:hypothetical protein PSV09DRAFT_2436838 [Bipolaris maydis]|nr:hypothetical protein J3E73DRAFT_426673 [Bipolaris maydis]KAJ5064434.1 hypothetical protein J3E74DRAFT_415470 [Bipolaris maydis]KAJ6205038.1 hypothetical protein PSV09DRAFT_2436838 [Bipolaris maydis]KAJ6268127.1 hypothetical protein PSV08DRAFT_364951 [Bipolaris maydis]
MRIPMTPLSTLHRLSISVLIVSTLTQHFVGAIPHAIYYPRQASPIAGLQLPGCALRCLITELVQDGCAGETDFACHCQGGKLMQASSACITQGCGSVQRDEADAKVQGWCGSVMDDGGSSIASSSTPSSTQSNGQEAAVPTQSSTNAATTSQPTNTIQSTALASTPTGTPGNPPRSSSLTPSETPSPTGTAVPALPESSTLSSGAKAGIGISVSILSIIAGVILIWYIHRHKSQAQAAKTANTQAPPLSNNEAIPRGSQDTGAWSTDANNPYPISPMSPSYPAGMQETTVSNIGYGMVMKKRGHVLSILLERDDEDASSLRVREPVPGQREGLAEPVELDGIGVAISELPATNTPRRSLER